MQRKITNKPSTKVVKKTAKKPTVKKTPKRLHAYPVNPDLFSSDSSLQSVIEYVVQNLEEKDSFTPYMLSICNKAFSLKQPKHYAIDLIYDLKAFTNFTTMSSLGKSKNYDVYWFCRDAGTSLVIIDKSVWNEKQEDKTEIIEILWDKNKHHFKVEKNGCKSIRKDLFFKALATAYHNGHAVYMTA